MFPDQSNLPEPYEILPGDEKVSYTFLTDNGITYVINLLDITSSYPKEQIGDSVIFEFQFFKVGDDKDFDTRIMATILSCIDKIMKDIGNVILYICDSTDGKQEFRSKLFGRWFEKYKIDGLHKIDGTVPPNNPYDEQEHVCVIVNENNPCFKNIEYLFNLTLNGIDIGKNPMMNI
jgi:hypothetical protein